ncbi:MAG: hypothetical protein IJU65_08240 [Desulfovibrio sp.]|nr:hypothetical protein [Desulfovibrio sp.]
MAFYFPSLSCAAIRPRVFSVIFIIAMLPLPGGCAWFGEKPQQADTSPGPVTNFMSVAAPGEHAMLDDADFGRNIQVRIDETFTSAKGENCKRGTVRTDTGETEVVVVCQRMDGRWMMAPRVWGQGITRGQ